MKQVPINNTAINLHCQTYGLSMILDKKNWNFTESHLIQLQIYFFSNKLFRIFKLNMLFQCQVKFILTQSDFQTGSNYNLLHFSIFYTF